jgi:hypothetical protein
MCEKRFRNGQGDNAVGRGTICRHRSVVDRHRGQPPDQVRKGVHQALSMHKHLHHDRPHGIREDLP